jgi:hypothetical protein
MVVAGCSQPLGVVGDSGAPADGAPDGAMTLPDLTAQPDGPMAMRDLATPSDGPMAMRDLATPSDGPVAMPDSAIPDLAGFDSPIPDLAGFDSPIPDLAVSDSAIPDLAVPDLAMSDLRPPVDMACEDAGCPCAHDSDCPTGLRCDPKSSSCVHCLTDGDCAPGTVCMASVCVPGCNANHACPMGQSCCGSTCANTATDVANCGACGMACMAANATSSCSTGMCGFQCNAGFADCDKVASNGCETPLGTLTNCTFCGDVCALPNATSACTGGACVLTSCNSGFGNCDMIAANGCEVNTNTDPSNCSSCGNKCPFGPNSTPVCNNAACAIVCDPGYADCDNNPTNGCEVHSDVDTANCGMCGNVCITPNATPGCTGGQCLIVTCNSGFADCDKQVPDGCEVNVLTSPTNCGMCGTLCNTPFATPACTNGMCTIGQCNTGYLDCNNQVIDGCEINGATDLTNCGMCGNVCVVANGTPGCTNSKCVVAGCNPGFQDCNGQVADGCEVNITNSAANCGTCGNACITPNAMPACSNTMCQIGVCNAGFKDCDGQVPDGCEVNILTDPNNCGDCNIKCQIPNGTAACVNGQCQIATCNTGFMDCNNSPADGCETPTGADVNNCGTCGHVCNLPNATASCTGGICTIGACNPGYTDCNNQPADGCEVHTDGDPNNCGSCGHFCFVNQGTAGCVGGTCTIAGCNAPYADCVNGYADGCETDTSTSNANCGGCGINCSTTCLGNVVATACIASACHITSCSGSYTDFDGVCVDGCECQDSVTATACGMGDLGTLVPGQSIAPFSSTLIPVMVGGVPNSAWFAITFTGNGSTSYHPKITLADPNDEFVMDVHTDCAGALVSTCNTAGEAGSTFGVGVFETYYLGAGPPAAPNPPADPTSVNINGVSNFTPIAVTGTLYIHVYRVNPNVGTTCNQYTLTASD